MHTPPTTSQVRRREGDVSCNGTPRATPLRRSVYQIYVIARVVDHRYHRRRFPAKAEVKRPVSWNHDGAGQPRMMGIEYLDGLYSYAMLLTRNHAEAEDLVQETYTRATQAIQKLRDDSNIKGWLFTVLKNIWFNQLRKYRNGPQMVEIEAGDGVASNVVEPSKDCYDLYVSKLEAEQVRAAIQELPVEFREIILLREFEDLSYREIASILHCPLGTVMSRLGRARAKLRIRLAAQQR
jgi:RNA polymerase sigma-70 factor (ECF subfamily)